MSILELSFGVAVGVVLGLRLNGLLPKNLLKITFTLLHMALIFTVLLGLVVAPMAAFCYGIWNETNGTATTFSRIIGFGPVVVCIPFSIHSYLQELKRKERTLSWKTLVEDFV